MVRVAEAEAGDAIECPKCDAVFEVPSDRDSRRPRKRAPVGDEEDERPRAKKTKKPAGPNWKLIAAIGGGVTVILIGVVLVLALGRWRKPGEPGGATAAETGGGTQALPADGIARIRVDPQLGYMSSPLIEGGVGDDLYLGLEVGLPIILTEEEMRQLNGRRPPEKRRLDIHRLRTGEKVAAVPLSAPIGGSIWSISPEAKYIAHSVDLANTVRVLAADGSEVGRLTPNAPAPGKQPDRLNQLHWFKFIAADRLLTVTNSAGYDIWTVPGLQRIGGRPGVNLPVLEGAAGPPDNVPDVVALSADAKTIAVYNGSGISVVDLNSGSEKVRTEAFVPNERDATRQLRLALSPDARRVFCLYRDFKDIWRCQLYEFDATTGKRVKETIVPREPTSAGRPGLSLWGPDHMVVGFPGLGSMALVHLPTGGIITPFDVKTAAPGSVWLETITPALGR
ncbi:MAG TPA: hypothetical protein VGE74_26955, partial [Gemmata sp.]